MLEKIREYVTKLKKGISIIGVKKLHIGGKGCGCGHSPAASGMHKYNIWIHTTRSISLTIKPTEISTTVKMIVFLDTVIKYFVFGSCCIFFINSRNYNM